MPSRWIVSALERIDKPVDVADPAGPWIKAAHWRTPAIERYRSRIEDLPQSDPDKKHMTQFVFMKGSKAACKLTADATPEAQTLLNEIALEFPLIWIMPAGALNEPLGSWGQVDRDTLYDMLRGSFDTDPTDPENIVWNPLGGYSLARIATRLGVGETVAEVKAELANRTLREIAGFLRDRVDVTAFDGTKIIVVGERDGGNPLEALD